MKHNIILLTKDFTFLNTLTIKKCIKLVVKKKVEIIKSTDKELRVGFKLPKVVRLLHNIDTNFSKKVPFSKQGIMIRDNYKCQYCGKQLNAKNATIDHVLPVSKGGKNSFLNCVCSCKTCNNWKDDKLLSETNMVLAKTPIHPTHAEFMYYKMKSMGIELDDIWK